MAVIKFNIDLQQNKSIQELNANKVSLSTYNAGMNDVNSKITNLQNSLDQAKTDLKKYTDDAIQALKDNEIKSLQDAINLLNADANTEGSVDYKISQAISNLIDGAPDALDTLKEIVDYIKQNDVNLENLIDSVKQQVTNLIDNASDDYNTLGKLEARIKELQAVVDNNKSDTDVQIKNVLDSIPVYKYDNELAIDTSNDDGKKRITLSKVPYGDVIERKADIYTTDADGNIIMYLPVTISKDPNDSTGKVYILEVPDSYEADNGVELAHCKAAVDYFWRPIDNA
jgi:chromosome segregation ATPase